MEVIDNKDKTMVDALKESLVNSDSIDILTAYFYFSGFAALANELMDKNMRILIGKAVDPDVVDLYYQATNNEVGTDVFESLDAYSIKDFGHLTKDEKKKKYTDGFCKMFNEPSTLNHFSTQETLDAYALFCNKIQNGSLEIKLIPDDHAKAYILTNSREIINRENRNGTVIFGSSNFTYNGLRGQGELNERFSDNERYEKYLEMFNEKWTSCKVIDICTKDDNDDFIREINDRIWISNVPRPYEIYIRILHELYSTYENESILTPYYISGGKFVDYKYQIDAIKFGLDSLKNNNGVIIADVVGLGKSIIAAAIAYNLNYKNTIIIAPPHLIEQWEEYKQDFALRGVKVYSSGKLKDLYREYASYSEPILYIIDEAHRYRNEATESYRLLHQLTRSNPNNKVILMTATPYNNKPQDLYSLLKLFQIPKRSTINTDENLELRFRDLNSNYNDLQEQWRNATDKEARDKIKEELDDLSNNLRDLIFPVTIRRSRIDLNRIEEYREDLNKQNIEFPEVVGPKLVEYCLGEIKDLYIDTLKRLTDEFKCVRYNPSEYFINPEDVNREYGDKLGRLNISLMQRNLSAFIKNLLVMRFESSKAAFKITLENIIKSYESIVNWWNKGFVPLQSQGYLDDPNEYDIQEVLDEINSAAENVYNNDVNDVERQNSTGDNILVLEGLVLIRRDNLRSNYLEDVNSDLDLLRDIYDKWFNDKSICDFDPKYDEFCDKVKELLSEMPERKIVVFSSYADTAKYVQEKLCLCGDGVNAFLYTGESSDSDRNIVKSNFDASVLPERQANIYNIIVATDALSEGFNLNRADVVINYDIPYNPTRVVQRIGRINRIGGIMFNKIYIFNFFPTKIGEANISIEEISTLKMYLINRIVGSDTRTLTEDEPLESYFESEYERADKDCSDVSWDVEYRNDYDKVKDDKNLMDRVCNIPELVRIIRNGQGVQRTISVSQKGNNYIFAARDNDGDTKIESPEAILKLFKAKPDEKGREADDGLNNKFEQMRKDIFEPPILDNADNTMRNAFSNIETLLGLCNTIQRCSDEKEYLTNLKRVLRNYDDLSDGEISYIASLQISPDFTAERYDLLFEKLKVEIPEHYLLQIIAKVQKMDSRKESIMFTEDLRA